MMEILQAEMDVHLTAILSNLAMLVIMEVQLLVMIDGHDQTDT